MSEKVRHIDVVWDENRDAIFAARLEGDIERLQNIGFGEKEIRRMIGTLDYVKFWTQWPVWLYPADKLPKGYKWTDGTKYMYRAVKGKSDSVTWTFLPAGDDLYIRLGAGKAWMPGTNIREKSFCRIKNYRRLTAIQVSDGMGYQNFLHDCIMKFWHTHGLPLGYVESLGLNGIRQQMRDKGGQK